MATTIKIKNSVTATTTPTSLVQGEVAINVTDKKVWVGNAATTPIQIVGAGTTGNAAGSNTQVQYNSSGSFAGDADFTFNGTTVTMANDASISGLTVGKGGGAVASNTSLGYLALNASNSGTGENVGVGYEALKANTTGNRNTAVGLFSAGSNTTGNNNIAIGNSSFQTNTTGGNNVAVGNQALQANTTASESTAVGYQSLYSNTTAVENVALGFQSLRTNTTGASNTAVGHQANYSNTTGGLNTAMGRAALYSNTTGANNTALGYYALLSNTTASNNTAVGYQAGYTNITGQTVTYLGYQAGYTATGGNNTFIGTQAGYAVTTGAKNTILGRYDGNQNGLDIRTLNNCIVLSDGDGAPRFYETSNGKWNMNNETGGTQVLDIKNTTASNPYGMNITFTAAAPNDASKWFHLCEDTGGLRFVVNSNGGIKNYQANDSNLSDIREKKNIQLSNNYLEKLCQVPVKTFLYNDQTDTDLNLGVIAQDLQAICPELVTETNWASEENPKMRLSVYETDLKYAMLKAIQELKAEVDSLKQQLGK